MNIPKIPDIYIMESSGVLNAFATRFFGRNMVVLYSSIFELILQGDEEELNFVIAHELAHIKRNHISKQLLILPALWIPGFGKAYSRACEYTCDRWAAYYSEDLDAAQNGLTILAVGKDLYKHINREEYLQQIDKEKGFGIWLSEFFSTHPPITKRILEIELFMGIQKDSKLYASESQNGMKWAMITLVALVLLVGGSFYAVKSVQNSDVFNDLIFSDEMFSLTEQTPPLIEAVIDGDNDQLRFLLDNGEDPNMMDQDDWTPLQWAVRDNNETMTKALLEAGADPNIEDYYGEIPLMKAAANGNIMIMNLLLEVGTDYNHQDSDGWTSLMYAVSSGQPEAITFLLKVGADPTIKDYQGQTAIMQAIKFSTPEVVNALRQKH